MECTLLDKIKSYVLYKIEIAFPVAESFHAACCCRYCGAKRDLYRHMCLSEANVGQLDNRFRLKVNKMQPTKKILKEMQSMKKRHFKLPEQVRSSTN